MRAGVLLLGGLLAACSSDSDSGSGTGGTPNSGGSANGGSGGSRSGGSAGQSAKGGASSGGTSSQGGSVASGGTVGSGGSAEGGSGGDGGASGGEGGGEGGSGGEAPGGAAGEGGEGGAPVEDGPILERTPRLTYDCRASRPLSKLEISPWYGGDLASTDDGVFFLRAEGDEIGGGSIVISTLDAAGNLGAPTPLESVVEGYFDEPILAAGADGFGALWWAIEYEGTNHLSFAELDAQGGVDTAAVPLVGDFTTSLNRYEIAAAGDGYAVLWADINDDFTEYTLSFGVIGEGGAFDGQVQEIAQGEQSLVASGLTAFGDGFVAAYLMGSGTELGMFLRFLAADGAPQGDPIPLGRTSYGGSVSLLPRGDELLVSHTVATGDLLESAATAVSIARFDASGAPTAPDVLLQTPVIDQDNVDGQLVALGDDVGLLWSQGSIIYICAGCMPDNHLEFVLLDGDDLTPLSEVVVLENLEPQGGYIRPRLGRDGDEFVVVSTLQYHVSGEAASAGIVCGAPE